MAFKCLSLVLAFGFSSVIILLARRLFPGWASDAAIGKGLALSFVTILLSLLLSTIVFVLCRLLNAGVPGALFNAFINAAFCEETARFMTLILMFRSLATDDVREFAAGAAALGIGFGIVENLIYLSGVENYVLTGTMRGVLSAPAHFAFGMTSAYGVWMWRRGVGSFATAFAGLSLAVFLHGSFDFALLAHSKEAPMLLQAVHIVGLFLVIVGVCVAGLAACACFLDRCDYCPPHDRKVSHRLGRGWGYVSDGLFMACVFWVMSPILAWRVGVNELGFVSALVIGAGWTLGLWSKAIRIVAEVREQKPITA